VWRVDKRLGIACTSAAVLGVRWQRKRQFTSTSSGVIVAGPAPGDRWLLTNAHSVDYHTQASLKHAACSFQSSEIMIVHDLRHLWQARARGLLAADKCTFSRLPYTGKPAACFCQSMINKRARLLQRNGDLLACTLAANASDTHDCAYSRVSSGSCVVPTPMCAAAARCSSAMQAYASAAKHTAADTQVNEPNVSMPAVFFEHSHELLLACSRCRSR
jgi:hypothetical protein